MKHQKDWYKDLVIYQIYPRSFKDGNNDGIGDLKGMIEKLDYLKELGINAVWMSPVYASPNVDNGYDISDYFAIMEEFGTMEDWDAFRDGAHERGIAIIMDLVLNHSSDKHKWFLESKKSRNNPYSDYYIWRGIIWKLKRKFLILSVSGMRKVLTDIALMPSVILTKDWTDVQI